MKNLKLFLFTLVAVLVVGFAVNVNADEPISVTTFEELKALKDVGGVANLDADITMTDDVRFNEDLELNLNGHVMTTDGYYILIVDNGSTLTIKDTVGNGKYVDNGENDDNYSLIQVGSGDSGNLVLDSGTIEGRYGLNILSGSSATINGGKININGSDRAINIVGATLTINGGEITATDENAYGITAFKDAVVIVNDGKITSDSTTLTGNGSSAGAQNDGTNAKFIINGGTLKSMNGPAIYAPQIDGETIINDGVLDGTESGIEIRAGKLTISGGTLSADTTHNGVNPNGNGTTTYGVAVAVAQHTTKQPIDVTITGGTFTGFVAVKESNPQENPYEDISKVSMSITGGTFTATSDQVVYSEDLAGFISGGRYNGNLDNVYVSEGFHIFNDAGVNVVADGNIAGAKISGIYKQTYNGKQQRQDRLVVKLYGQILEKDKDYQVLYNSLTNAGTVTMTIKGIGNYQGSVKKTFVRAKAKNTLTVKAYNKTVYYSKVRKSAQVVKPITIVRKQGTLTYTKLSGSSTKLLLNKTTGKVTVKKGTKKGKYKIRIKVYASGNANYFSNYAIKTVYVTVK